MQPQANSLTEDQRTEEWFKARLGRATGSRFKDVMTTIKSGEPAARKNYRTELAIERLTGERLEGFTTSAMQWGIDTEPLARLQYELATGNQTEECGFFAHPTLMAGASPDGLIGEDGVLEIKCPNSATHVEALKKNDVPYLYYWQIQGQMWITGRKYCDFVSFDPRMPENAQLFIKRIERDDERISDLEATVKEFLESVDREVQYIETYGSGLVDTSGVTITRIKNEN